MPKTTVDEDDLTARGEYQVRLTGKTCRVQAKAVSKPVDEASNGNFGLGVLGADSGHVARPLSRIHMIDHNWVRCGLVQSMCLAARRSAMSAGCKGLKEMNSSCVQ